MPVTNGISGASVDLIENIFPSGGIGGMSRPLRGSYGPGYHTFVVPSNIKAVEIVMFAGGGREAHGGRNSSSGGGGGGAACSAIIPVTPGESIPITVGQESGSSSFGTYVTCGGGSSAKYDSNSRIYPGSGGRVTYSGIPESAFIWKYDGTDGGAYFGGSPFKQNGSISVISFFGALLHLREGKPGKSAIIGVGGSIQGDAGEIGDMGYAGGCGAVGFESTHSDIYITGSSAGNSGYGGGGSCPLPTNINGTLNYGDGGKPGTGWLFLTY